MAERSYVALDLETTGLDPQRDAIIEIGAVRFQGDRILDQFTTLVNPKRSLPLRIQQLTGIRGADLADAPLLAEVAPELLAFVGQDVAALVAHNADFDLGFLRAAGLSFHRPALDTFELSTILLPNIASYNLGELCRHLEIPQVDVHRAAGDAQATAQLFMRLQERLRHLPAAVLELIVEGSRATEWTLLPLFAAAHKASLQRRPQVANWLPGWVTQPGAFVGARVEEAPAGPLSPALIEQFFSADGLLAAHLGADYESRPGQQLMASAVSEALNEGDHLLIEAGTGAGKSLAYLLPAASWSVTNRQTVVIATNTLALQDQLLYKEIPQTQSLLAAAGLPRPQVALLKGRTNYLCTRRLHRWRRDHRLTAPEVSLLAKLLVWLTTTTTGDASELLLVTPGERAAWLRLCSDPATCSIERCGCPIQLDHHTLPVGDFFLHAQQRAAEADLLVVNHALLLVDLASGGHLLPAYDHLIVDEAHHLEEVTTDQLTTRIDWRSLRVLVQQLGPEGRLGAELNLALDGLAWRTPSFLLQSLAQQSVAVRHDLAEFAERLVKVVRSLEGIRAAGGYPQRVALDSRLRSQPAWSQLEIDWEASGESLRQLVVDLERLVKQLDSAQWWQADPGATLFGELRGLYEALEAGMTQLDYMILAPTGKDGLVHWLEYSENDDTVLLATAPLYVNTVIAEGLVQRRRSAIFTSATLRTGGSFDFIQERLGLWDANTITIESPFDYATSTLLLLPSNLPAPNQPTYQAAVEEALIEAAGAAEGRTLALFTSHAQLRAAADAIRQPLDEARITVLQQGAGSRGRLLREFRATERAVLLGARSFWEGIDLPGDELCCLLIARLPFATPSDPLVAARTADLEDAFNDYTLPDAILRFRQGFGRLIRRAGDRGVVVVLDSRLWQRGYGRTFLESLPHCTVRRPPLANLGEEIRTWLG